MTTASSKILLTERYVGERKKTNVSALYFCIGFIAILFGFMGYSFCKSNISRTINGYDDCGNICGVRNDWNKLENCGSNDKTEDRFQFLIFQERDNIVTTTYNEITGRFDTVTKPSFTISKKCVERCEDYPDYTRVGNRCLSLKEMSTDDLSFIQRLADHITELRHIVLMGFAVALIFSYITLVLFRYAIKYIVWGLIFGGVGLQLLASFIFLASFSVANASPLPSDRDASKAFLLFAAGFGIFGLVTGLFAFFFRKHINLVIQIFKEAAKAINDIPMIAFEPLLTFLTMLVAFSVFLYFFIVIDSAGDLSVETDSWGTFVKADYEPDAGIITTHVVNLIAFSWFTQFIISCQHFVIASTISDWYFARSKDELDSPIFRGIGNLWKFHLGSICLGSIIFIAIRIVQVIIAWMKATLRQRSAALLRLFIDSFGCIFQILEEIMQYLVRNAYIIVAKDGTPLYTSGKRAFGLLKENLVNVIVLNRIRKSVFSLARIFVVIITGFVTYGMLDKNVSSAAAIPVGLVCVFAFLVIHCFITVFEMTLDTIFICFCEDCEQNNGTDRPYFMSQDLMDVMEKLNEPDGVAVRFGRRSNDMEDPLIPPSINFEP